MLNWLTKLLPQKIINWNIVPEYQVTALGKLFEHFDAEVFDALGFISGHSLKHVAAALGMYMLLVFYQKRNCNLHSEI